MLCTFVLQIDYCGETLRRLEYSFNLAPNLPTGKTSYKMSK